MAKFIVTYSYYSDFSRMYSRKLIANDWKHAANAMRKIAVMPIAVLNVEEVK
jgi:hypothetical protein